jgi:hypothetical protein
MDHVTFLTDPIWSERASPLSFAGPVRYAPPAVALGSLPPVDFVVVSHSHYDHLDLDTLRLLNNGRTRFFVPLRQGALLREHGIGPVEELDWWESRAVGGVTGLPDARDLERLSRGIVLDGRRTLPAKVKVIRTYPDKKEPQSLIEVVIREGRNRQVRKMCEQTGHHVMTLRRTRIGAITDRRIKPGQVRELTPDEVKGLVKATHTRHEGLKDFT